MRFIVHVCVITLLTVFILPAAGQSATQITGTVTAKRADSVKVEFKPHETAGSQKGDRVDFMKVMEGFEVKAQSRFTLSRGDVIWA